MTLETLDRTIFEFIRLAVVESGYLPDWRSYSGTNSEKQLAYNNDKQTIRDSGKEIIEVFGVGTGEDRYRDDYNRIVIDRASIDMGVGMGGFTYTSDGNSFIKTENPSNLSDVYYEIRTFSGSTKYDRIMLELLMSIIGFNLYTKSVDSSYNFNGDVLYFRYNSFVDVTSTYEIIERLLTVTAKDLCLGNRIIEGNVVPLTTIDINTILSDDLVTIDTEIKVTVDDSSSS